MKLVYILLVVILIKCLLLYKMYDAVPVLELKRQAKLGNKRAKALYQVANYEGALDVFLWLLGTAAATALFIWSAETSWWLAIVIVVLTAGLGVLVPAPRWDGWVGALAALTAKYQAAFLSFINPVFGSIAKLLPLQNSHTNLYEKRDLMELISQQLRQPDNRIEVSDLKIAEGALTFGDKLVRSIMTPRRQIKFVKTDETVGPMLMDELHKTGHSRFPVTKDNPKTNSPQIVGTLYLKDIIGFDGSAKVKDLARKDVYYINEDSNLRQALGAFLKTHHHLLIVVNNFEEIAGVLSIEDVFEQIIGQPINDEFDNYDSLRAVAAKEAEAEKQSHDEIPVAPESD